MTTIDARSERRPPRDPAAGPVLPGDEYATTTTRGTSGRPRPMRDRPTTRSLPTLLRELRDEAAALVQQEFLLARAEITREVGEAKRAVMNSVVGAVLLAVGLVILAMAASAGIYAAMLEGGASPLVAGWVAPLIMGLLLVIIGGVMTMSAKKVTDPDHWRPDRTEQSLRETRDWAERKL